jgi:hypothetical protein
MDYEITEGQLLSLINRIIIKHYGQELVMDKTDAEYVRFTIPGVLDKFGDDKIMFHKNYWGLLWVGDENIYIKIQDIFGFDEDEIKYYLRKYFETKYNIEIKKVALTGGY